MYDQTKEQEKGRDNAYC